MVPERRDGILKTVGDALIGASTLTLRFEVIRNPRSPKGNRDLTKLGPSKAARHRIKSAIDKHGDNFQGGICYQRTYPRKKPSKLPCR